MHAISKEFIMTMQDNCFGVTEENLHRYFDCFARISRTEDKLKVDFYLDNLKKLNEDRDLIVSELKGLKNENTIH